MSKPKYFFRNLLRGIIVDSPVHYCRFHLVCPGQKIGERNFFWAWYKLKLICVLYFHFVPNLDKVPLAKFFPERGGGTNQVESTITELKKSSTVEKKLDTLTSCQTRIPESVHTPVVRELPQSAATTDPGDRKRLWAAVEPWLPCVSSRVVD